MRTITAGREDQGTRLDGYLRRYLPKAPDGFLYKMLRKKNIVLNGKRAAGSERLSEGDTVTLFLSDETIGRFSTSAAGKASSAEVSVLYEDPYVLAADKPAGLLTQGSGSGDESLTDRVTGYLLDKGEITEESLMHFRPSPANRLDRNTSGVVLFGKTLSGIQALSESIRGRKIGKVYTALVRGNVTEKTDDTAYLSKIGPENRAVIYDSPQEGAVRIETGIEPVLRGEGCTLLRLRLLTGKPHQLRARLADLGHPVAGDPKYGDPEWNRVLRKAYGLRRQFLHASSVTFPGSGGILPEGTVRSPLPEDLARVIRGIYGIEYDET